MSFTLGARSDESLHYQCALLSAVFLRASQCMFKTKPFPFKCQLAKKGAAYEITISYFPKPFKQPRTYHS